MNYWRMQLHPDDAQSSSFYANESIVKGFIGLGFATEVGDLLTEQNESILDRQKSYRVFATDMSVGDKVLIMSHHVPLAVVTITSDYNYIRTPLQNLGVWFNHFREIDTSLTIYYSDYQTNIKSWESITMTNTVSSLIDPSSKSYQLIDKMTEWSKTINS